MERSDGGWVRCFRVERRSIVQIRVAGGGRCFHWWILLQGEEIVMVVSNSHTVEVATSSGCIALIVIVGAAQTRRCSCDSKIT